jgi:hypothetical protein
MGEAADHFTGLTSCAAFRDDGDGTHLDNLLMWFFIVNDITNNITHFVSLSSTFYKYIKNICCVTNNMFTMENVETDSPRCPLHEVVLWDP